MLGNTQAVLTGVQRGVGFSGPGDYSPVAWYDFSDSSLLFTDAGSTNVSSDGDLIYQANDKSTSNNHLLQASSTLRPLYKTGIQNSLSVGRFDGADDYLLATANIVLATDATYFVVANKIASDSAYECLLSTKVLAFYARFNSGDKFAPYGTAYAPSSYDINSPRVTSTRYSGGAPYTATTINVDDNAAEVKNVGSTNNRPETTLGCLTTPSKIQHCNVDFLEVIFYSTSLTDEQTANVKTWLNNKWAVY